MDHVAWLLEPEGCVRPVIAVERVLWPTLARVTYHGGATEVVPRDNVLSRDDLGVRYNFTAA